MGDLGEQDGYPAGVSNADFVDEDAPCADCGHSLDDHDGDDGPCICGRCLVYMPMEAI